MSENTSFPDYQPVIVPALHAIQHEFGYLKREALEEKALELNLPLYRLHSVASFFPHFRLVPPKKVIVGICRDMACHMNGASETIADLKKSVGDNVEVHGLSCVGRCDRATAACISMGGSEHENYYLKRTTAELQEIVEAHLRGEIPKPDLDADLDYPAVSFVINAYGEKTPDYAAALEVISIRNKALDVAVQVLESKLKWSPARIEQFRRAALGRVAPGDCPDKEVGEAVMAWGTNSGWAKDHTYTGEPMPPPPPKPAPGERAARDERPPSIGNWSELILKEFEAAPLRGMGGAGLPSAQKLRDVRESIRRLRKRRSDTRGFIVVNGDESEPATFKDREILLRMPHTVVEGVIIAGILNDATQGFIYIRHEYTEQIEACREEVRRAEALGLCGRNASVLGRPFPVEVFMSPGGYVCGEQSALIEALSDRRGEPRNLPPMLETNGLEDQPTIVSNVETYAWMPYITIHGGKGYAKLGINGSKGRRLFSVCGDVKRPGVYEVAIGMTLRELLYDEKYCGGIVGDRALKAFAPSGPSAGFIPPVLTTKLGLPEDYAKNPTWVARAKRLEYDPIAVTEVDILDLELELDLFRAVSPTSALGAGLCVYAEGRDMIEQAVNALEFFRNESCGKCVPCRLGSQKLASLGANILEHKVGQERWEKELVPLIADLSQALNMSSICALGRGLPAPFRCAVNYFSSDLTPYLNGKKT